MLLRSNFSSFPHYFIYIFLTSGVKLHIHLLNVIVQFIVFLTLSTLICRGTDISKCFSESLGIRDNESRLYLFYLTHLESEWCIDVITALAIISAQSVISESPDYCHYIHPVLSRNICYGFTQHTVIKEIRKINIT